jgi:alkanesulfonate monooxygenase SsuD/methylene tetrahydromethanopterin reductase-like flavin-dependent oxidoreductase (luciferase family)
VRLGVLVLPEFRWSEARPLWARVEELGFDHAWTYDHLAWRSLADSDWFGAVPVLAAAAVVTSRIRLGTLVASPNFRHPVPFARELITLDDLSGGRFTLGIGAGGTGWDATVLGHDPWSRAERTARFVEFVEMLDLLLRQPVTSQRGRYYRAVEARSVPGCVQQPRLPFAVAATGGRGMALAAAHGQAWVTTGPAAHDGEVLGAGAGARAVGDQIRRLDDACAAAGRDPATLDRIVLTGPTLDGGLSSVAAFDDVVGCYAEVGVTDLVVHWPRPAGPYAGDRGVFEAVFSDIDARRGVR